MAAYRIGSGVNLRLLPVAVAVLVLGLSLVELLDLFELPVVEALVSRGFSSATVSVFNGFVISMAGLGYAGVFALMALESASLPIPSELVLPFAGYLVFKGSMAFVPVLLVCTLAGLVGGLADYLLAMKLGRPAVIRLGRRIGISSEQFEGAERWISSRGSLFVLVARFVPGMRSAVSFPAGALGMSLRSFVTTTLVGSFGWSLLLIYLGYKSGPLWQSALVQSTGAVTEAVLVGTALLSAAYLAYAARSLRR